MSVLFARPKLKRKHRTPLDHELHSQPSCRIVIQLAQVRAHNLVTSTSLPKRIICSRHAHGRAMGPKGGRCKAADAGQPLAARQLEATDGCAVGVQ